MVCFGNATMDREIFYYQVDISQVHILRITTVAEMYQLNRYFLIHQEFGNTIAWERLAASFDGIEIAPYQDAFRLHPDFLVPRMGLRKRMHLECGESAYSANR